MSISGTLGEGLTAETQATESVSRIKAFRENIPSMINTFDCGKRDLTVEQRVAGFVRPVLKDLGYCIENPDLCTTTTRYVEGVLTEWTFNCKLNETQGNFPFSVEVVKSISSATLPLVKDDSSVWHIVTDGFKYIFYVMSIDNKYLQRSEFNLSSGTTMTEAFVAALSADSFAEYLKYFDDSSKSEESDNNEADPDEDDFVCDVDEFKDEPSADEPDTDDYDDFSADDHEESEDEDSFLNMTDDEEEDDEDDFEDVWEDNETDEEDDEDDYDFSVEDDDEEENEEFEDFSDEEEEEEGFEDFSDEEEDFSSDEEEFEDFSDEDDFSSQEDEEFEDFSDETEDEGFEEPVEDFDSEKDFFDDFFENGSFPDPEFNDFESFGDGLSSAYNLSTPCESAEAINKMNETLVGLSETLKEIVEVLKEIKK